MADDARKILTEAYLSRREALLRYFTLRTGSPAKAEDLVQDLFLKIQGLDDSAVAEVRNTGAFLYKIGSNLMLDRLKQDRRAEARDVEWQRGQGIEIGAEAVSDAPSAEQVVESRQRIALLRAALRELSPQAQRAFELHKLQGLSHSQAAAAMGVSRSAVEKHISNALRHLMRRLE